jgi:hypothetical protein
LRLAPLPFPLLPAVIPPLKRWQMTLTELRWKHLMDSTGTNTPNVHLCNTTGGFPPQKHIAFHRF